MQPTWTCSVLLPALFPIVPSAEAHCHSSPSIMNQSTQRNSIVSFFFFNFFFFFQFFWNKSTKIDWSSKSTAFRAHYSSRTNQLSVSEMHTNWFKYICWKIVIINDNMTVDIVILLAVPCRVKKAFLPGLWLVFNSNKL